MAAVNPVLVFGATGAQGGAVVRSLLKAGISVRAVSRNPDSEAGKALTAQGVQVVKGDMSGTLEESIFTGASAVFLVTNFNDPGTGHHEFEQGKAVVDLAAKAGVPHFIFSSLPNSEAESGGKYKVPHFTHKALLEDYIKGLNTFKYTSFPWAPFYYQNFNSFFPVKANEAGDLVFTFCQTSQISAGDIEEIGAVVTAAIQNPEKYGKGNQIPWVGFHASPEQLQAAFAKRAGKPVQLQLVPREIFATFPFPTAPELAEMFGWIDEYGSFGKKADLEAAKDILKPKSFDDWLAGQQFP